MAQSILETKILKAETEEEEKNCQLPELSCPPRGHCWCHQQLLGERLRNTAFVIRRASVEKGPHGLLLLLTHLCPRPKTPCASDSQVCHLEKKEELYPLLPKVVVRRGREECLQISQCSQGLIRSTYFYLFSPK